MTPRPRGLRSANRLKHQPSSVLRGLALNRHVRPDEGRVLRELRETIVGLLREPDQTICAECVATALGRQVGVVMMSILGLRGRVASFEGVCSTCHQPARVLRYEAPSP